MKGGEGNAFAKKIPASFIGNHRIVVAPSLLLDPPLDLPPVDNPPRRVARRRRLDKGRFVLGTVFLAFRIPDQQLE